MSLQTLLKEAMEFKPYIFTLEENGNYVLSSLHIPYQPRERIGFYDFVEQNAYIYIEEEIRNNNLETIEDIIKHFENNVDLYELCSDDLIHHTSLIESGIILSCIDNDYIETDDGLWEGMEAEEAITAKAFYSYRNYLLSVINNILEKHNKEEEEPEVE